MLTDEQLTELFRGSFGLIDSRMTPNQKAFCRAIEAAACAERDSRIAELERQIEDARTEATALRVNEMNLEAALLNARAKGPRSGPA